MTLDFMPGRVMASCKKFKGYYTSINEPSTAQESSSQGTIAIFRQIKDSQSPNFPRQELLVADGKDLSRFTSQSLVQVGNFSRIELLPILSTRANNHAAEEAEVVQPLNGQANESTYSDTNYISEIPSNAGKRVRGNEGRIDGSDGCQATLTANLTLPTVLELTDSAFRSLISYRPGNLPAKLKVAKESCNPSLSAIAPALWCPGYRSVALTPPLSFAQFLLG